MHARVIYRFDGMEDMPGVGLCGSGKKQFRFLGALNGKLFLVLRHHFMLSICDSLNLIHAEAQVGKCMYVKQCVESIWTCIKLLTGPIDHFGKRFDCL